MADIQSLIEQARAVGRAMAQHELATNFLAIQRKLAADPEAQRLLRAYSDQVRRIQSLEQQQRPIEVADKQKLAAAQRDLASHETLREFARVQADYMQLVYQVHQALDEPLAAIEGGSGAQEKA